MFINIKWDHTRRLGILESDYLDNIREHFSVKDKNASIKKLYTKWAPSRKYAITTAGRFDPGLFAEIYKYAKSLRIPFDISVDKEFKQYFKPSYQFENTHLSALKLDLRDYQAESVQRCLQQGNGILKLATGAGKTLLMGSLVKTIHDNTPQHFTVIIVPSTHLVEQTYKDFLDYGISPDLISRYSGKHEIELGKPIVIAGSQLLLVGKNIPDLLFEADLLIVDEVHGLKKENELNKLIKKFKTPHKFGLTGTLPDDQLDVWNIIGKMGPIVYEKDSFELRKEGYLAPVVSFILQLRYINGPSYSIPSLNDPLVAYNEEKQFIIQSSFRNKTISSLASKTDNNTLIIVDRIEHGENLKKIIESVVDNKQVFFIQGSVEVDDREIIRDLMENHNNIICIAMAKIFSTGINIKNLHFIILAAAGKAKVRLIQSIGRGLRPLDNKKLVIFDISDQLKYGKEHEQQRLKIYDNEKIQYTLKYLYEEKEEGGTG